MKTLAELLGKAAVEEIIDAEVMEVAAVDRPATNRRWRFYKRAKQGISPTLAAGMANYTACLATGEQPTPTACEGNEPDALGDLRSTMVADMAGHDASLTEAKAFREVEAALSGWPFVQRGAKCPGPEVPMANPQKDEQMPAPPPPPVPDDLAAEEMTEAEQPEAIEVPGTPTEWALADCIGQAQELGLPEQAAIEACQIVRGKFGDPEDETTIFVPEGTETAGLINAAALEMGMGKSIKAGTPMAKVKFKGPNRWSQLFKRFLGRPEPTPGAKLVAYLSGVETRLGGVMTEQSKMSEQMAVMLEQNGHLIRTLAALAGAPITDTPAAVSQPAVSAATAAPGSAAAVAPAGNPLSGSEGKAVKDGAAAGAPIPPQQPTPDERIAALEQMVQQLIQELQGAAVPNPEDEELPELVGAGAGAQPQPTAVAVPKRVSVSTPPVNRLWQGKSAMKTDAVYSTILGTQVSASEREASRNSSGLPRVSRR
jgi:hypothetical protein